MTLNLLIGGAAGQGIETMAAIFEKLLKQAGHFVYTTRDFMSRVRGGHNFTLMRFGDEPITSHSNRLDALVALNEESIALHRAELSEQGFILCDNALVTDDPRVIKIDMQQIAKGLGNPKVAGSVAIGALMGLFGLDLTHVPAVLPHYFAETLIAVNSQAIEAGYKAVQPHFTSQPGDYSRWMTISGNQALALGALTAGLRFYSAYPMSPSTSIMEVLADKGRQCNVVVEQAEDEIAAVNMAIGASFAGARAMTGTSGGGFCLMVEGLGLAGMTEVPLVMVDVQRPGPATGLPTRTEQSDLRFVISASHGEFPRLVIALRDHRDAYQQTRRAFDIAERYQMTVILLSDEYLADTTSTVEPFEIDLPDQKHSEIKRFLPGNPDQFVAVDSDEHDEYGHITESAEVRVQMTDRRLSKSDRLMLELQEPELIGTAAGATLLIGWGSMCGPLSEAVTLLNQEQPDAYCALVFGDIFPLPTERLRSLAQTAQYIINVEQNATGQLGGLVREVTGIQCHSSILKYDGRQISGEEIAARVREVKRNG